MSLGRSRDRARGRGGAPSFTPTQVPGLQLYLDAQRQTGFVDGDPVGTATDFSGLARDCTGVGAARPTFKTSLWPGSRPAYQYAGAQVLTSPGIAITSHTIFSVFKATAGGAVWDHTNGGAEDGYTYLTNGGPSIYRKVAGVQEGWDLAAAWGTGDAALVVCDDYDGTHANHNAYVNSTTARGDRASVGFNADAGVTSSGALAFGVGARAAGTLPVTGLVASLLVYSPAITASQRAQVITYLAARWGVTLT